MRIGLAVVMQQGDSAEEADFTSQPELDAMVEDFGSIGHDVVPVDFSWPLTEIARQVERHRPELIVNTVELIRGERRPAGVVPTVSRLLGLPCTGPDARAITIGSDKWLTKRSVPTGHVRFAPDAYISEGRRWDDLNFPGAYPVIVKPNFGGSSQGIGGHSIAESSAEVGPVLERLHGFRHAGVIVEQFIPGLDITVGCVEQNGAWRVLTPITYDTPATRGQHFITQDLKTWAGWPAVSARPADLPPGVRRELDTFTLAIMRGVGAAGTARIDLRLSEVDGLLYALEVNVIAALESGAGLALSASHAGLSHAELLTLLLSSAR
jgi:D-alanine-D-alanine ligase